MAEGQRWLPSFSRLRDEPQTGRMTRHGGESEDEEKNERKEGEKNVVGCHCHCCHSHALSVFGVPLFCYSLITKGLGALFGVNIYVRK
jgi:hypothetical protein